MVECHTNPAPGEASPVNGKVNVSLITGRESGSAEREAVKTASETALPCPIHDLSAQNLPCSRNKRKQARGERGERTRRGGRGAEVEALGPRLGTARGRGLQTTTAGSASSGWDPPAPREETPSPQAVARRASRARPTPPAALGKAAAARSTLTCRALCRASLKASLTPPPPPPPAEPDDGGGTVE